MKQSDKVDQTNFLYDGSGNLPKGYLEILRFLYLSPNKTSKDITKALKKKKVYSELGLLYQFGFVTKDNYPRQYKINNKGLKSLGA